MWTSSLPTEIHCECRATERPPWIVKPVRLALGLAMDVSGYRGRSTNDFLLKCEALHTMRLIRRTTLTWAEFSRR